MSQKHVYFNRLLLKTVLVFLISILVAKAGIEDGGDPKTYALWTCVPGAIYFAVGLLFMNSRVKKMGRRDNDRES